MQYPIDKIAAVGRAVGGALGLAGAATTQPNLQAILWAIDSAALVIATSLLTTKYFRKGNDLVAAGFMVFAIGEAVLLSGTAAGPAGSVPAFAAGTALWATALLLISIPKLFNLPIRILGAASGILFIITSGQNLLGRTIAADVEPIAELCIPLTGGNLHWLDLDILARSTWRVTRQNCSVQT